MPEVTTDAQRAATLAEYFKQVDESNERFLKGTLEEKRVMIAEDILKQLAIDRIIPMSTYIGSSEVDKLANIRFNKRAGDVYNIPEEREELRDLLRRDTSCQVCGIGAIFVSIVDRLDAIEAGAIFRWTRTEITNYVNFKSGLFTDEELKQIEDYFEAHPITAGIRKYRLTKIAGLIIESKGGPLPKLSFGDTPRGIFDMSNANYED